MPRSKFSHENFILAYWGQRGHLKISWSSSDSTPSLKHRTWLIGASLPTILSFGLSICQEKKESNIPILNFLNLDPTACDKAWLSQPWVFSLYNTEPHWFFSVAEWRLYVKLNFECKKPLPYTCSQHKTHMHFRNLY